MTSPPRKRDLTGEQFLAALNRGIADGAPALFADNFEQPLTGLKIVVDAGNGAGGFYVDKVLKPLGADTTGSQFLEPDGTFPNHVPNPEDKQAMQSICQAVIENQADFAENQHRAKRP